MCGICCILENCPDHDDQGEKYQERLQRRGPDQSTTEQILISEAQRLTLSGHVLHLRGELTPQPLTNKQGDYLLWNGEIFGGIQVQETENDTKVLLDKLSSSSDPGDIISTMAKIEGPWAFVYWQSKRRRLWFGRDIFGRRSLLWHLPEDEGDKFILSSIKIKEKQFLEVPSIGIYCLSIPEICDKTGMTITAYPREGAVWPGTMDTVTSANLQERIYPMMPISPNVQFCLDSTLKMPNSIPPLNKSVPTLDTAEAKVTDQKDYLKEIIDKDDIWNTLTMQLTNVLLNAVRVRVYNQPELCSSNAGSYSNCQRVPQEKDGTPRQIPASMMEETCEQMDKISVDRDSISNDHGQMSVLHQTDTSDLKFVSQRTTDVKQVLDNEMAIFDAGCCSVEGVGSQKEGTCHVKDDVISGSSPAKVAILFSGGIDSSVIAALVDRVLPEEEPVDLINVAFEQRRNVQGNKKGSRGLPKEEIKNWDVPDRQTGYTALAELNPNRKWNFILVNVSLQELQEIRSQHVRHLVYPLETVLDDSIGCAVWFAARGCGILGNGSNVGQEYKSSAKVILCGMGADEQFAGYSRHRGKFQENGWQGLIDEIELEVTRISARNLGRDDRIITDHGKEARFPFLDENVVKFLQQLPIHQKANLTLPRGLGEKLLLRVCATKLGLVNTAVLPKRAIQFGSRIAKIENNKEKASDKCERLV